MHRRRGFFDRQINGDKKPIVRTIVVRQVWRVADCEARRRKLAGWMEGRHRWNPHGSQGREGGEESVGERRTMEGEVVRACLKLKNSMFLPLPKRNIRSFGGLGSNFTWESTSRHLTVKRCHIMGSYFFLNTSNSASLLMYSPYIYSILALFNGLLEIVSSTV